MDSALSALLASLTALDADAEPGAGEAELFAELRNALPKLVAMIGEMEKMVTFGETVLEESRDSLSDLDGGWLQDKAEELGILVRVTVEAPCGEQCRCAEYGDFPMECLRRARQQETT